MSSGDEIPMETMAVRDLDRCEVEGCRRRSVYGGFCVGHAGPIRPSFSQSDGLRRGGPGNVSYEELDRRVAEVRRIRSERKDVEDTSMRYKHQQGNEKLDKWRG